jgi:spore coat protein E
MSNYKEIVTKAIIGKSKKTSNNEYVITPDKTPDTILGCWVINHNYSGINNGGVVLLNGNYDINVWYSYDNDTKTLVASQNVSYSDKMPVHLKDNSNLTNKEEIIVRSLKQPTVTKVNIEDGLIKLNVEKELGVEVVGDTKIKVNILDDEEDYEEIVDNELNSEDNEAIDLVDEEYLK